MKIFRISAIAVVVLAALAAEAAPKTQSSKTNVVRSVFALPANPSQGRDPFFPDSTRPYQHAAATHLHPHPLVNELNSLVVQGFSGNPPHRLVIINNYTFAAGDGGDIVTPAGRIHLRCLVVKTNSVIVQVGNQRRELFYSNKL